jgi:hypothetical protein
MQRDGREHIRSRLFDALTSSRRTQTDVMRLEALALVTVAQDRLCSRVDVDGADPPVNNRARSFSLLTLFTHLSVCLPHALCCSSVRDSTRRPKKRPKSTRMRRWSETKTKQLIGADIRLHLPSHEYHVCSFVFLTASRAYLYDS